MPVVYIDFLAVPRGCLQFVIVVFPDHTHLLFLTFCLLLLPLWESIIVLFCYTLRYVHSSIAIILMEKRELDALLYLSSWCLVMVEWLFLAVPWGYLRFVIVVFPDRTHLLFSMYICVIQMFIFCASQTPRSIVYKILWLLILTEDTSSKIIVTVHFATL